MDVRVIQFMRPFGDQTPFDVEVNDSCGPFYGLIKKLGFRLTAESLVTGMVSCCIEHPTHGDFNISRRGNTVLKHPNHRAGPVSACCWFVLTVNLLQKKVKVFYHYPANIALI